MKAVAHRPHDLEDIRGVVAAHPTLDRDRVRRLPASSSSLLAARLLSRPR